MRAKQPSTEPPTGDTSPGPTSPRAIPRPGVFFPSEFKITDDNHVYQGAKYLGHVGEVGDDWYAWVNDESLPLGCDASDGGKVARSFPSREDAAKALSL